MAVVKLFDVKNGRATITKIVGVGIYKITSPTNKIYIGQSHNLSNRFLSYSRKSCKSQIKLYSSIMKYGYDNHKFEIIHELPNDISQEVMNNYEILYWQQYKDCGFEMMNLREPGKGGKMSEESKKRMSLSKLGKKRKLPITEEFRLKMTIINRLKAQDKNYLLRKKENALRGDNHPKSKKVYQFDLDGNFIKEWSSITEAGITQYGRIVISKAAKNPNEKIVFNNSLWKFYK